ncbi:hypothetical protein M8C21_014176 [Ambrosia artemisiifolia]|uniref:Sulfotransferase n=1 Tax=Ambrosia artemisiifolia TaxID=4212 RepID=A0AAD5GVM0_AMBAR|nr:hypothetical protein M8C21_014176 [Ambrosia artemisiifolia]
MVTGLRAEDPEVDPNWLTESLYMYQGYCFPLKNLIPIGTVMASQDVFQANSTNIYMVTLPKSGTTWIKALAFAIMFGFYVPLCKQTERQIS